MQRPGEAQLAQAGAPDPDLAFVPNAFPAVQPGDQPQDPLHGLGPLGCRLEEVAPGVRPATEPHHAVALAREGRVVG